VLLQRLESSLLQLITQHVPSSVETENVHRLVLVQTALPLSSLVTLFSNKLCNILSLALFFSLIFNVHRLLFIRHIVTFRCKVLWTNRSIQGLGWLLVVIWCVLHDDDDDDHLLLLRYHHHHVDGVRLCLWTPANNGTILHPRGDIWAWRTIVEWWCLQRKAPDSSTRALW
jgi:hypothetical protein